MGYVKRIAFNKEISVDHSTIRLIYQGKLQTDDVKLSTYSFDKNPYIHALITKADQPYYNLENNSSAPS